MLICVIVPRKIRRKFLAGFLTGLYDQSHRCARVRVGRSDVHVCMYMYVHVCTCMYMYVHVCTCMYMYVCVYVLMYVYSMYLCIMYIRVRAGTK